MAAKGAGPRTQAVRATGLFPFTIADLIGAYARRTVGQAVDAFTARLTASRRYATLLVTASIGACTDGSSHIMAWGNGGPESFGCLADLYVRADWYCRLFDPVPELGVFFSAAGCDRSEKEMLEIAAMIRADIEALMDR